MIAYRSPADIAQRQDLQSSTNNTMPTIPNHINHGSTKRKRANTIERTMDSGETRKLGVKFPTPHAIPHSYGPKPRPEKRSKTDDTDGLRMPDVLVYPAQLEQVRSASNSDKSRPSWLALPFNVPETRWKSQTLGHADSPTTALSSNAHEGETTNHGVKLIENMVLNLRRKLVIGVLINRTQKRRMTRQCTPAPCKDVGQCSILAEMEYELQVERETRRKMEELLNNVQHAIEILRSKLSEMDVEFSSERKRREELEKELASERKRRVEVENILNDVERECRAPFVVPAMMEAFKTISRLTTWNLDLINSKSSI